MRDDVDPKLRQRAATMRKAPTEPERRLWWALRHSLKLEGTHFRRQVVIGRAIVDFACIATRTIVELDGEQHGFDGALAYDARRTLELEAAGWRVLRFWNGQVTREWDQVLETVPWPLPVGTGRGRRITRTSPYPRCSLTARMRPRFRVSSWVTSQ
jgi:very-short-patch-repair endonuclease